MSYACCQAQVADDQKTVKRHEYSLNVSPLLFQLVPFKTNDIRTGPYNFSYAYRRNNKSFHLDFGLRQSDEDFEDLAHLNLRMGYRNYRTMSKHWEYYRGLDMMVSAGGFNLPGDVDNDSTAFGFGFPLGIVYRLNDYLSLSTEGILFIGVSSEDFRGSSSPVQIVPPISVMMTARL